MQLGRAGQCSAPVPERGTKSAARLCFSREPVQTAGGPLRLRARGAVAVALNFAPEPRPVRASVGALLLLSTRPATRSSTEVDLATVAFEADEGVIVAAG